MVELKDRINKPRIIRGTPSYSFINKFCGSVIVGTSVIGLCIGYFFYAKDRKREDYGLITSEKLTQQRQEDRVRIHIQTRRDQLRALQDEEDDKEFYKQ